VLRIFSSVQPAEFVALIWLTMYNRPLLDVESIGAASQVPEHSQLVSPGCIVSNLWWSI
jgi:hypothetical protein